ncbi:MAG: NADPH-dependent FMN reductase [Candidatus Marinarcus sp.]|uniref:NADPH-dependent FMN reductase n=1 Tax=Candidatus Marinarcus sp. TaxID=3100987 RepID=UPI003AFF9ACE
MKILAFAASNSSTSINKQLVTYATTLIDNADVEILDLNDYELPLYSEDRNKELGEPALAKQFLDKIASCDALIISFAEHNLSYSVAYKNIFDWASRIERNVFAHKPMVMLSTSPGARGGLSVLEQALKNASFFTGDVKASFSVPNFYENFDMEKQVISNEAIKKGLITALNALS